MARVQDLLLLAPANACARQPTELRPDELDK